MCEDVVYTTKNNGHTCFSIENKVLMSLVCVPILISAVLNLVILNTYEASIHDAVWDFGCECSPLFKKIGVKLGPEHGQCASQEEALPS